MKYQMFVADPEDDGTEFYMTYPTLGVALDAAAEILLWDVETHGEVAATYTVVED